LPINSANLDEGERKMIRDIFYPEQTDHNCTSSMHEKIFTSSRRSYKRSISQSTSKVCVIKEKPKKKRGRKKRDPSEGWPKQALSGYNIFYKEERVRILLKLMSDEERNEYLGKNAGNKMPLKEKLPSTLPSKSEYTSGRIKFNSRPSLKKPKVTRGKISFHELVKTVSSRWRALSAIEIEKFNSRAKVDQERYSREVKIFLLRRQQNSLSSTEGREKEKMKV